MASTERPHAGHTAALDGISVKQFMQ